MITNNDILQEVKKLFNDSTNPEIIKQFGSIETLFKQKQDEDDKLIQQHKELIKDYKDAIMNSSLPPMHSREEAGGCGEHKSVSLEDIVSQVLSKK